MSKIIVTTEIHNSLEVVFDLSRSIDLHKLSTSKTNEDAIAGVTKGLIKLDETVTWKARHLFKYRLFTSKITAFKSPVYFKDVMQQGDFKTFEHEHLFEKINGKTKMTDIIFLEAPFGLLGKFVMFVFLKNYIKKFLLDRNALIKDFAETNQWKQIIAP